MRRVPLWVVVGLLLPFFFAPVAIFRYVDGDEGYYLGASALVWDGRLPYIDFFYPQMPGLRTSTAHGASWRARAGTRHAYLSTLLATGIGVLMAWHVSRRSGVRRRPS
jgi:hypothetical protein